MLKFTKFTDLQIYIINSTKLKMMTTARHLLLLINIFNSSPIVDPIIGISLILSKCLSKSEIKKFPITKIIAARNKPIYYTKIFSIYLLT